MERAPLGSVLFEKTLWRSILLRGNLQEGAFCRETFLLVILLEGLLEWVHFERVGLKMILPFVERELLEGTVLEEASWERPALLAGGRMEALE